MIKIRPCHHISAIAMTYMASTRVISSPSRAKSMPSVWKSTLTASPNTSGAQACSATDTRVMTTAKISRPLYGAKTWASLRKAGQKAVGLRPGSVPSWVSAVSVMLALLRCDDLLVHVAGVEEFVVGSSAHNPAVFQHQNVIGVADGRHPLGDDQNGRIGQLFGERGAQFGIGRCIKRRKRVVEQVDFGLSGQGASNR